MDFLTNILAGLFDKFKAGNPKLAAFIMLLLGSIIYWVDNGLGAIIGVDLLPYAKWVSVILLALQGSRTTGYLAEKNQKK